MKPYEAWLAALVVVATSSWESSASADEEDEDGGVERDASMWDYYAEGACYGRDEGEACGFWDDACQWHYEGHCSAGYCTGGSATLDPCGSGGDVDAGTPAPRDASVDVGIVIHRDADVAQDASNEIEESDASVVPRADASYEPAPEDDGKDGSSCSVGDASAPSAFSAMTFLAFAGALLRRRKRTPP